MMYSKHLLKRGFASQGKLLLLIWLIYTIVSHKFPENTVAGLYKRAVAENQYYDAVRFGAQKFNWTVKEMDVSSYCINMMRLFFKELSIKNIFIEIFISIRSWISREWLSKRR